MDKLKFYSRNELETHHGPFTHILTPEGLSEPSGAETTSVVVHLDGSDNPHWQGNTGYGASYIAQVNAGMDRAGEYAIATPLKNDGEFTVWFTSTTKPSKTSAERLFYQALNSLPSNIARKVRKNILGKMDVMEAPAELGLVNFQLQSI